MCTAFTVNLTFRKLVLKWPQKYSVIHVTRNHSNHRNLCYIKVMCPCYEYSMTNRLRFVLFLFYPAERQHWTMQWFGTTPYEQLTSNIGHNVHIHTPQRRQQLPVLLQFVWSIHHIVLQGKCSVLLWEKYTMCYIHI